MVAPLVALALGAALLVLHRLNLAEAVSPDGHRYRALGRREPVPMPFALRWLLPLMLGDAVWRWRLSAYLHLLALPPLLAIWLRPWVDDARLQVVGALLVCGLSGVWRIHIRWPVLVDGPAMTWALGCAVAFQYDQPVLGVALAVIAGSVKESGPVFAACFAWHLLPLIGLTVPLIRALTVRIGVDPMAQPHVTRYPVLASRVHHLGRWFDARSMILPWGAGILAALATDRQVQAMLAVTAALAYGQLVIATDTIRLYQWAAPPVILGAMTVLPPDWAVLALILHLFNPWAGTAEV
ncbi:hypothetical protein [Phytohabitans rumicis]|uniref:Uncharacterized protein n=1 Tax=Phytohabitans rumicis TaxID=1076125 RepID=A0A6V8LEA3_9ACTN|nr:hypothetical protein [Phytohabitans rumicis]GFJ95553.1 hypothetical protein Prum_091950 [Phytohabitans rumicis]